MCLKKRSPPRCASCPPLLPRLPSPQQDDLTTCQSCMKSLSRRQATTTTPLWPPAFSFPSVRFLGKFQFPGVHCFPSLSLLGKGRGASSSLEYLPSCQECSTSTMVVHQRACFYTSGNLDGKSECEEASLFKHSSASQAQGPVFLLRTV